MTQMVTVDDMKIGLRATFRTVIDQDRIDAYADVAEDHNPIHVDAEYAAGTRFGTTIAHGMLVAGFFQHPLTELVTPGGVSTKYEIRMMAPVPPGTEIEAFAECVAIDTERRRATSSIIVLQTTSKRYCIKGACYCGSLQVLERAKRSTPVIL